MSAVRTLGDDYYDNFKRLTADAQRCLSSVRGKSQVEPHSHEGYLLENHRVYIGCAIRDLQKIYDALDDQFVLSVGEVDSRRG